MSAGWGSFIWSRCHHRDSSGLPGGIRPGQPPPVWPCSGWGLPCPPMLPPGAVVSYTTFSPLPSRKYGRWRSVFCGAFPSPTLKGRGGWCYQPPCPVESGLSSLRSRMIGERSPASGYPFIILNIFQFCSRGV